MASTQRPSTVDVTVVRWLDGHRIVTHHSALSPGAVVALKIEEGCLPGTLASFTTAPAAKPYEPQALDGAAAL